MLPASRIDPTGRQERDVRACRLRGWVGSLASECFVLGHTLTLSVDRYARAGWEWRWTCVLCRARNRVPTLLQQGIANPRIVVRLGNRTLTSQPHAAEYCFRVSLTEQSTSPKRVNYFLLYCRCSAVLLLHYIVLLLLPVPAKQACTSKIVYCSHHSLHFYHLHLHLLKYQHQHPHLHEFSQWEVSFSMCA